MFVIIYNHFCKLITVYSLLMSKYPSHPFGQDSGYEEIDLERPISSKKPLKSDKIALVQKEVEDVTAIMKDNIYKTIDRGDKLEQLQQTTQELAKSSESFGKGTKALRKRMCWNNYKVMGCIFFLVLIIIGIIIAIAIKLNGNK